MTDRSKGGSYDYTLIGVFAILVMLGWLNIYAATYSDDFSSIFDLSQLYGKQLLWIGTATVIAFICLQLDFRFFQTFSYPLFIFSLVLLAAVLVFGKEIKGAQSWFVMGPISFQPSELAKFGTALALSNYLSSLTKSFKGFRTRAIAFLIILSPALLILLQPDTGSVLVYTALIFVLYREGLSGNVLLFGLLSAFLFILSLLLRDSSINLPFDFQIQGVYIIMLFVAILALLIFFLFRKVKQLPIVLGIAVIFVSGYVFSVDYIFEEVLSPHQQDRINELLGITSDPTGAGYNVHQSKIAIGSGGWVGKGFLQGTQTKFDFVPEQSTDFIFCTVGEEWGFLGSLVVVVLFIFLLFRIIYLSEKQRSKFARIYGYCVASIFFFHFAINIGMTIGLAPVIGIPLPFFSYGGSSLWGFTLLLFAFIKMDSDRINVLR
ncbi:MAG TPA: rod shape-determining protein RodA [Flavobacteriales bacterium]|jgi:rod shape determining protein RodA|nr:rod shape-determining protein RodA [Salibacteraceae bacterium]HAS36652.1 rod shape-determining protein RodA [Flavobacteriales bacterium]